jgi:hypothetical protein
LEGGRTSHLVFKIPIAIGSWLNVLETSTKWFCWIAPGSKVDHLGEVLAQHQHCVEVVDQTLRNNMQRLDSPFGDKVVVFEGDFRQCLLVVSRGSRATIISTTFWCSVLWHQVCVLTLTENMRFRTNLLSRPYVKYLLRVGNGRKSSIIDHFPSEADAEPLIGVEIALCLKIHQAPSLDTLIHVVFSALAINYTN